MAESQSRQSRRSLLDAIDLLERLLKAAEAQSRTGSVIEILVVLALAHRAQGDLPEARASLERALTLAVPQGYFRLFVDEGEPMHLLLLDLRSQIEKQSSGQKHSLLGYVDKLLSACERAGGKPSAVHPHPAGLIEPLSDRELEVLRLVALGLTNEEISRRLFLAMSTVKGHNLRIFGKLQARNRAEAVARARELGLL